MPKHSTLNAQHLKAEWFEDTAPNFIFRPIHYLGSKLRVLTAIEEAINRVDPSGGPVCDLFSGSGTVSRYLSQRRQVMAVDIQEYARVLAEAVLNADCKWTRSGVERALEDDDRLKVLQYAIAPLANLETEVAKAALHGDIEPLCDLLDSANLASIKHDTESVGSPLSDATFEVQQRIGALGLTGADTVCIRHFGGQYFSYAQSAELDAMAAFARRSGSSTLLAATLSTASHLVNSIGKQFAQPIRPRDKSGNPKRHVIKKIVSDRSLSAKSVFLDYSGQYAGLATNRTDHVAIRADFMEALLKPKVRPSVVYADPPYTRDHYSRFYHSLETIALGDDPIITRSNLGGGKVQSRGSYRAGRHQSSFSIKSKAPEAFSNLFEGVAALSVPLVLSYSGYDPSIKARPRVMSLQAVIDLARKHFAEVQVKELSSLNHMKLNSTSLNSAAKGTTEVLLLCR